MQRIREERKEAGQKTVHCHLSKHLVQKLGLLAPLYEVRTRFTASGGQAPPALGGFIGKLLEDIFLGPKHARSLCKALDQHWAGHPSMIPTPTTHSKPPVTPPESAASPRSPPNFQPSTFSFATPPAASLETPSDSEPFTPSAFLAGSSAARTPIAKSRLPAFIPSPFTPNQREKEGRTNSSMEADASEDAENDLGVEMQETSQSSKVSFLHVSRAYQLAEFCATHGAHGSVVAGGHSWWEQCLVVPLRCTACDQTLSWTASKMEPLHCIPELNGRAYAACLMDGGTYEQLRAFYAGERIPGSVGCFALLSVLGDCEVVWPVPSFGIEG